MKKINGKHFFYFALILIALALGVKAYNWNQGVSIFYDKNLHVKQELKASYGDEITFDYVVSNKKNIKVDEQLGKVATLGKKEILDGIERNLIGKKEGEKVIFTIGAKEAFGEKTFKKEIDKDILTGTFTEAFGLNILKDSSSKTLERKFVEKISGFKKLEKGKKFFSRDIKKDLTIKDFNSKEVIVTVENDEAPFYKKSKKVGTKVEFHNNILEIVKIGKDFVEIKSTALKPMVAEKDLKLGAKGNLKNGEEFTVKGISGNKVQLEFLNQHPLAGQTLTFEITIRKITH